MKTDLQGEPSFNGDVQKAQQSQRDFPSYVNVEVAEIRKIIDHEARGVGVDLLVTNMERHD